MKRSTIRSRSSATDSRATAVGALLLVLATLACGPGQSGAPHADPRARIDARSREARKEIEEGDPELAEALLSEALALARHSGAADAEVEPRLGLALLARLRKDPAAVAEHLARARAALAATTPVDSRARLLLLEAVLALDASDPEGAVQAAESALGLCAPAGDARCQIDAWVALANARGLFQARHDEARAAVASCLGVARGEAREDLELRCVNARAHLAYNLADYPTAVDDYARLAGAGPLLPERIRATASLNLALCRIHLGLYGPARLAIEQALAAAREPGRTEYPLAVPLYYRGYLLSRLGDVEGALADFEAALEMFRAIGNSFYESFVLVDVGDMLLKRGLPQRARTHYEKSLAIHRRSGSPRGLMLGEEGIGRCLLAEGSQAAAEEHLRAALRRADEVRDDHGWARIAVVLADGILRARGSSEAQELLVRARDRARRSGLLEEQLRATIGIARCERDAGRRDRALARFLDALDQLDRIRGRLQSESQHLAFSDSRDMVYREAVDLALAAPAVGDLGFEIAERGRARALAETEERTRLVGACRSESERRARLEIVARVSRAETRLLASGSDADRNAARAALDAARSDLESHDLSASAACGGGDAPQPISLEDARQLAPPGDGTLAVFWLGAERSVVWRIRRAGTVLLDLGPRQEIVEATEQLRAAIAVEPGWDNPADRWRAPARRLARLLRVADLVSHPEGARPSTLLLVPDGPLHAVPFGPLLLSAGRLGGETMLANVADVAVVPSVSHAGAAGRVRRADDVPIRLFALGDPDRSADPSLPPLPGARSEVQRIAALFPYGRAEVRVGEQATESALRDPGAARAGLLHVAARAVVSDERPEATGLVLASDAENDGFVRLEEVAALQLDARIAVLSACGTALGRPVAGEGLLGLSRAFVVAGVPVVVPSLWDVSDRATGLFMERFYRRLLAGQSSHGALSGAARDLRDGTLPLYGHPHYWAAFVHLGTPIDRL